MKMNDATTTYITTTIPSFFRCPISLDVMRSPVSLCTGVTYDRASIQRWLDGGNNTCPATMQVLKNRELVPNLTLQRLIEVWSDSVGRRSFDSQVEKSPENGVPTVEEANEALEKLNLEIDDEIRVEMLSRIVRFARESEANREFLVRKEKFVPMLVDIVASVVDSGARSRTRFELLLRAIRILDTIRSGNGGGDREHLSNLMLSKSGGDCLTAILLSIQRGNLESKIASVRVLEWIAIDAQSKLVIAERDEILQEILKSITTESDPSLIEAILSFLITISTPKRVRSRIISAKAIAKLRDLLVKETMNVTVGVTEKTLKLLEILSSRREGRSEICDGGGCVEGVVRKLLKVSTAATEHAVAILWMVCYLFRSETAEISPETVVERGNGVAKLLVVMQSDCSPAIRQMAKDLIKVMKVKNPTSCLVAYDTNTTHIMPF